MNDIHDNLAPIAPVFFTVFDWIIVGLLFVGIGVVLWILFVNKKKINNVITRQLQIKKFVPKPFSFETELKHIVKLQSQTQWKDFSLEATTLLKRILDSAV